MSLLLDTNVISELVRPRPDPKVLAFIHESDEDRIFVSAVTWAELSRGIALLPDGTKRQRLANWLETDLRERFASRILNIDAQVADRWGLVMAEAQRKGRRLGVIDGFLAATAHCHGLALVTRNVAEFDDLGLPLINPWA